MNLRRLGMIMIVGTTTSAMVALVVTTAIALFPQRRSDATDEQSSMDGARLPQGRRASRTSQMSKLRGALHRAPRTPTARHLQDREVSPAGPTDMGLAVEAAVPLSFAERQEAARGRARARQGAIQHQLGKEGRDADWAPQIEAKLDSIAAEFEQHGLEATEIVSARCGRSLCEVEVFSGSSEEHSDVMQYMDLEELPKVFGLEHEANNGHVWMLYFARDGFDLPRA